MEHISPPIWIITAIAVLILIMRKRIGKTINPHDPMQLVKSQLKSACEIYQEKFKQAPQSLEALNNTRCLSSKITEQWDDKTRAFANNFISKYNL